MESNLAKLVEVYKARMTMDLALMFGMTTVTGYALSLQNNQIFSWWQHLCPSSHSSVTY